MIKYNHDKGVDDMNQKIFFNKLVRDQIPEIIESQQYKCEYKILSDEEYSVLLEKKLDEEVQEFHCDKTLEELADILEVTFSLCESIGYSKDDLMNLYHKKHLEKGGFSKKIYLISKEKE